MALTATNVHRQTSSTGHGAGVFTTSGFTPGTGLRLIVRLMAISNSNDTLAGTDLTITDSMGPLTWTPLKQSASGDSPGWSYAGSIWISSATSSGASMTLGLDAGAFNVHDYRVEVESLSGEHASPLGGTAIGTDADGEGAASITLDATPAAGSIVFAMAIVSQDSTAGSIDVGADFTEEAEVLVSGWGSFQTQRRTGSTSTTVAWADLNNGGSTPTGALMMAVEIKAAASATVPRATLLGAG